MCIRGVGKRLQAYKPGSAVARGKRHSPHTRLCVQMDSTACLYLTHSLHFYSSRHGTLPSELTLLARQTLLLDVMAANLANFNEAMHHVYGDMNTTTADWTPPSLSSTSSRHLYTDAIAVINYITLSKLSLSSPPEADTAKVRARLLIDSVHDTLGRTQDGSRRLNGASDQEPLKGGLRSGTLLEGDADGQSHRDLMYVCRQLCHSSPLSIPLTGSGEQGRRCCPYILMLAC